MKPILGMDADIFQGVGNDDQYTEAEVRKELRKEKEQLDVQMQIAKDNLKQFEEKVKREKAKKNFTDKKDFLLRETLDKMESTTTRLNDLLKEAGSEKRIAILLREQIAYIYGMNIYLASDMPDILYDYNRANIYKKIKENNADFERTNKKLREIEIRETDWIQLSSRKPRGKKNRNN